MQQYIVTAVYR